MLFYSFEFLFIFLPISFFGYFFLLHLKRPVFAKIFLVLVSLFFYSWWNLAYLPILIGSIVFNYFLSLAFLLEKNRLYFSDKAILVFGLAANIILLGYFKYADFFIDNINIVTNGSIPLLHLALPLAISFFTFQQIAYLVDSYRGLIKENSFLNYALFVSFFPQLIAGPIVHHSSMMPQFASHWNMVKDYRNIALGIFIFSIGLFKKVIIADSFALWVTTGFDHASVLTLFEAWATSLSYTFQLYFDFSGYIDMAIGLGLLFNIRLPQNFNSPYKARNIQEFWRRWHITLSLFIKEYIYIPLGGNRGTRLRTYINLGITFFIVGLWHGAGWNFVLWGTLHGVALVVFKVSQQLNIKLFGIFSWFLTFNFVNFTWVFFRAENWEDAFKVLSGMFGFSGIVLPYEYKNSWLSSLLENSVSYGDSMVHIGDMSTVLLWIMFGFIVTLVFKNTSEMMQTFKQGIAESLISAFFVFYSLLYLFFGKGVQSEFIYFNF